MTMPRMLVAKPVEAPEDDHENFLGITSAHPSALFTTHMFKTSRGAIGRRASLDESKDR